MKRRVTIEFKDEEEFIQKTKEMMICLKSKDLQSSKDLNSREFLKDKIWKSVHAQSELYNEVDGEIDIPLKISITKTFDYSIVMNEEEFKFLIDNLDDEELARGIPEGTTASTYLNNLDLLSHYIYEINTNELNEKAFNLQKTEESIEKLSVYTQKELYPLAVLIDRTPKPD